MKMDWRSNVFFFLDGDLNPTELDDVLKDFDQTLSSYKTYGVNTVSLTWFNPVDLQTAEILDTYGPEVPSYFQSLPTDEALLAFTKAAHDRGFKVMWKPHFNTDETVSGNVSPFFAGPGFDVDTFLSNVKEYWKNLAPLAETADVDLLIVGTEQGGYAGPAYDTEWREIIATVRDAFSGELTYDALSYVDRPSVAADDITFWGALDYIGISMYLPLADGTPSVEGAYNTLKNNWIAGWQTSPRVNVPELFEELARSTGKDIIFTEAGSMTREGALTTPPFSAGALDFWEQTVLYGVLMDEFSKYDWFRGFNWWNNDTEFTPGIDSQEWRDGWYPGLLTEFGFVQKPSGDIVRGFWGDGANGAPLEGKLVIGGSGPENLKGGKLGDLIVAGNGDDRLAGRNGDDRLFGGDGRDVIIGGKGNDLLIGGSSFNDAKDRIVGGKGADKIEAGAGNDVVFGGAGRDKISGGEGGDRLYGQGSNDVIRGQQGSDTLVGGEGKDTLIGGNGADKFVFKKGFGADTIVDFKDKVDQILLSNLGINSQDDIRQVAANNGADLVLSFSADDVLTIRNTDIAKAIDDFIF